MRLEASVGQIQIQNSFPKTIVVDVKVFPAIQGQGGKSIPATTPFSQSEVDLLIRLRPTSFRLGSNALRNVTYKVIDPKTPVKFFVCAESTQGFTRLRHCSRWAPSP
jgi:hypothetical protein